MKKIEECKYISIRLTENEELYRRFHEAKKETDKERIEKGGKKTSCAEFAKMLIHRALKNNRGEG